MNQNYDSNTANKQLTLLLVVILGLVVFLIALVLSNRQSTTQSAENGEDISSDAFPGNSVSDITYEELEAYLRSHTVDGNISVAIKKASLGDISYLATVHGYPNNMSVCEDLIEPYNNDASLSVISGQFFCERLE